MNMEPQFNLVGTKYPHAYAYGYLSSLIESVARNAQMAKDHPESAEYYIGEIIKAKETMEALRKAVDNASAA